MQVWIESRSAFDFEGRERPRWDVVGRDGRTVSQDGLFSTAKAAREWAATKGYILAKDFRPGGATATATVPRPDRGELGRRKQIATDLVVRHPTGDSASAAWLNSQLRERGFTWGLSIIDDRLETYG